MPTGHLKTTPTQTQTGTGCRGMLPLQRQTTQQLFPSGCATLELILQVLVQNASLFVTLLFIQNVFLFHRDQKQTRSCYRTAPCCVTEQAMYPVRCARLRVCLTSAALAGRPSAFSLWRTHSVFIYRLPAALLRNSHRCEHHESG